MKTIKNLDKKLKDHNIEIDSKIYSIKAVKKASYDFSDRAWFFIKEKDKDKISITITPKEKQIESNNQLILNFMNNLLDHQVRLEVSQEFKIIREMIVAQAFEPCDNLKDIVDTFTSEDAK